MPRKKRRPQLRDRVNAAGGWYAFVNAALVRAAGPAAVGPYTDDEPPARDIQPCPLCRQPMRDHRIDRNGPKPLLRCP
jgi:hypothetical protein